MRLLPYISLRIRFPDRPFGYRFSLGSFTASPGIDRRAARVPFPPLSPLSFVPVSVTLDSTAGLIAPLLAPVSQYPCPEEGEKATFSVGAC